MPTIPAAVTEDYLKFLPMLAGNIIHPAATTNPATYSWNPTIQWFKMGEGGWILNSQGKRVRRVAVPDLRMLKTVPDGDYDLYPLANYDQGFQYDHPPPYPETGIWGQALDAEVDFSREVASPNPPRYLVAGGGKKSRYVGEYHSLASTDLTYESPSSLVVRCFLDFDQENDDGYGFYPEFCELGLYADHPLKSGEKLLVAYCTFPKELKDENRQLENIVRVIYG